MAVAIATTTWGDPTASKRVLLIHGLTGSSPFWHRLAHGFTSQGYFVVAPNLLGHGCARRGEAYAITALVDELRPLFSTAPTREGPPYDVVVGHSFEGIVAAAAIPLLVSSKPVRVVLVDPPFELALQMAAMFREMFTQKVVGAIFDVWICDPDGHTQRNIPWSFTHYLSSVPENVKVMVLAADPPERACVQVEDVKSKAYPRVEAKTVWGASYLILLEVPGVVIEAALEV